MQSWSSQRGQCIFCAFRSIARPSPRQSGSRLFHSEARLARNRAIERLRRQSDDFRGFHVRQRQDNDVRPRAFGAARKVAGSLRLTQ
jgi:hypothetical protein